MQMWAQIVFDNGMVIEDGEICLDPCVSPSEMASRLSLLVTAIADNGVKERAQEDLSWLLMATSNWHPRHFATPACVLHEDGRPLNELEEYLTVMLVELSRLPGLNHEHVKEITVWYCFNDVQREQTFYNDAPDICGNWLADEIRKGIKY